MVEVNMTLKHIQERSSIRAYQPQLLTSEEVDQLKAAVLAAPTARDRQELRYAFVTDRSMLSKADQRILSFCDPEMKENMKKRNSDSFFYGAPLVVIIFGKDTAWADLDAGIAVQTLAIAAQSMGLSSVILGMPRLAFKKEDPENCRSLFGLEDDERFCIAISIGKAATEKTPHLHNPGHIRIYE